MSALRVVLGIAGAGVLVFGLLALLDEGSDGQDELRAHGERASDSHDRTCLPARDPLAQLLEQAARVPVPIQIPDPSFTLSRRAAVNRAVPVLGTRPDPLAGITVFGHLFDAGGPHRGSKPSRLVFDDGGVAPISLELPSDSYAVSHLTAGRWHVTCDSPGYRPAVLDIELGPDVGLVKLDLTLERGHDWTLEIMAVTPEGEALSVAATREFAGRMEEPFAFPLRASASREPPADGVIALSGRAFDSSEWGTFVKRGAAGSDADRDRDDDPDGDRDGASPTNAPGSIGTLYADGASPLFVSMVLDSAVLQTQRVEEGATQVVFTLPVASLRALPGGVRIRVVSADTGRVPPGLTAHLRGHGSDFGSRKATADGSFTWVPLMPGSKTLSIRAPGHELLDGEVHVPLGGVVDLGTLELTSSAKLAGHVVSEAGAPVAVVVRALRDDIAEVIDPERESGAGWMGTHSWDTDGHFELAGLGRHIYRVVVSSPSWAALPVLVDLRQGDVRDVRVTLAAGARVRLRARWLPAPPCDVRLTTADGVLVSAWEHWCGDSSWTGHLAAGAYSVALLRDGRALKRIPFKVGAKDVVVELAL